MSSEDNAIDASFLGSDRYIEAKAFFDEIIRDKFGQLSEAHVYAELSDYLHVLHEVPAVYSHVTCGRLSKPSYFARDVISYAEECADFWVRATVNDVLNQLEDGVTIEKLRKEYEDPKDDR